MAYLMNAWYCAGWGYELNGDALVGRKLLGKHICMYRKIDGSVVAMDDACPHRFAPLSQGCKKGDSVECPYHGLRFGSSGECTLNPHGDGKIPRAAKVQTYPLVERWDALWIWMGDAERLDLNLIPDFSMTASSRPGYRVFYGHHQVPVNYLLVGDNLLDRSHVQFLHPLVKNIGENPPGYQDVNTTEQDGDTVWDYHCQLNSPKFKLLDLVWPEAPDVVEPYFDLRWQPPCNMLLASGTAEMHTDRKVGVDLPMANLITPADEESTHYFWNMARNRKVDTEDAADVDAKMHAGVSKTFETEDRRIVELCRQLMGTSDLMSLNPVLLVSDNAAMRARRIVQRKIEAEQNERAVEAVRQPG